MTKPKLLIVGAFPSDKNKIYGGIVTACKVLIDTGLSDRYTLILIDTTQKTNPPPVFSVRLFFAICRIGRYIKSLYRQKPDIVLLFASSGSSLLEKGVMAWLSSFKGVPAVLFPRHGGLIEKVRCSMFHMAWVRPIMHGAKVILCQGPAWRRFAVEVIGFAPSRTHIVHNWSATASYLNIGSQRNNNISNGTPRILFMGWLEENKGIYDLLEACSRLSGKYKFILSVAGKGHAEANTVKFVEDNRLTDFIKFVGWVDGEEKENLLRSSDILVLPSWAEGFPNVVIEAMAAKLAVIVSEVGNVPDLLENRRHALIIPAKNTIAIENALIELFSNHELRWQIAEAGHLFAQENFSSERGVEKLSSVLNGLI
jgi:glycosyltransferase involved in cell wall biosynthesis